MTKIYLADPQASTDFMARIYSSFGLTDAEIDLLSSATMKRDYFYTSPMGRRLFQLDLGQLTLSLIGSPNHAMLDDLASKYENGSPLCEDILTLKRINYKHYIDNSAPVDRAVPRKEKINYNTALPETSLQQILPEESKVDKIEVPEKNVSKTSLFLDAVASLPERKRNDGQGRAASAIAGQFGVSVSTVYQARAVLKYGWAELVEELRQGIPVKTAYKKFLKGKEPATSQAQAG
jgi:hypothetical protein